MLYNNKIGQHQLTKGDTLDAPHLILGAIESTLKSLNAVLEPEYRYFRELTSAKVKEALGEEEFRSAFDEGSKWTLGETTKKVLGDMR